MRVETDFLVIATSQYIDDAPPDDTLGDYTAIPLGAIKSVVRRK